MILLFTVQENKLLLVCEQRTDYNFFSEFNFVESCLLNVCTLYVLFYFILDIRYGGAIDIFNIIICWNEVGLNVSINGYICLHFVVCI